MARKTFSGIRGHFLIGKTITIDAADPTGTRVVSISGLPNFGTARVHKRCEDYIVLERVEVKKPTGGVIGDCEAGCYGKPKTVICPATFYLIEFVENTTRVRCVFNETTFKRIDRPQIENQYEVDVLSLGGCEEEECCRTVDVYRRGCRPAPVLFMPFC